MYVPSKQCRRNPYDLAPADVISGDIRGSLWFHDPVAFLVPTWVVGLERLSKEGLYLPGETSSDWLVSEDDIDDVIRTLRVMKYQLRWYKLSRRIFDRFAR